MEINEILVFQEIPPGWRTLKGASTPPVGYKLICNGKSRFSADYKTGLIEDKSKMAPPPIPEAAYTSFKADGAQEDPRPKKIEAFPFPVNQTYLKSSISLQGNR